MTRPMPGPHEHPWTAWYYACTACSGMWDDGDEHTRQSKRLTDAECESEYRRAISDADDTFDDQAEWEARLRRVLVWGYFLTHPHAALNGETND